MASKVRVSLESFAENEIQEIAYDGTEKTILPPTLSDNLTKLANLIDFGKKETTNTGTSVKQEAGSKAGTNKPNVDPVLARHQSWDWLRNSLRSSLTEMNVLADCLTIAKEKRVMSLEQIQPEPIETKNSYLLLCRKQALQAAGEILQKGSDALKGIQQEIQGKTQRLSEFHSELYQLRQNWRVKKVGDNIVGDLSFKSAGSAFWQNGTFEVFKKTSESSGTDSIDVRIPPELQGSAYIQVSIHMTTPDDSVSKLDSMLVTPQCVPTSPNEKARWQVKLETAQNILFCKELFSQISREAFQLEANIPHMVVNNQIIVHLFPDFKMHITFCHSHTEDKLVDTVEPISDKTLQLALHQLLREQHFNILHKEPPHPVTASIGPTKRRRIAGPVASSVQDLLSMDHPDQINILRRLVDIARHTVLRLRVVETVEHLANIYHDPMLQIHTDHVSDELHSSLHVHVTAHAYDVIKSSFMLKISEGTVTAISLSGVETPLSHDVQKVQDYIVWQLTLYQVQAVHHIAKLSGWTVLSSSWSSNRTRADVFGTQPAILVSTPDGGRAVAVKSNTVTGVEVYLSRSGVKTIQSDLNTDNQGANIDLNKVFSDIISDSQWTMIRTTYEKVDMAKMSGRNFNHKIELLLASQNVPQMA